MFIALGLFEFILFFSDKVLDGGEWYFQFVLFRTFTANLMYTYTHTHFLFAFLMLSCNLFEVELEVQVKCGE